jgi:NIMA (never in mitosis gene a)-related kinase
MQIDKEYRRIQKIGEGSYGKVTKVIHKETSKLFVLKEVDITKMSPKQKQGALNEIFILKSLHHKNILKLIDSSYHQSKDILISKFNPKKSCS